MLHVSNTVALIIATVGGQQFSKLISKRIFHIFLGVDSMKMENNNKALIFIAYRDCRVGIASSQFSIMRT